MSFDPRDYDGVTFADEHSIEPDEASDCCLPCEDCGEPVCGEHRVSVVFEDGSRDLCFTCAKRAMDVEDGADALERKVA